MKRFRLRNRNRVSAGKLVTAALVGSAVGAAVGLLLAPASGREILRRIRGAAMDPRAARERTRTVARNVESQARELAAGVGDIQHRGRVSTSSPGI
jgi:gas vesicle protein